jgi:hypothetical protein
VSLSARLWNQVEAAKAFEARTATDVTSLGLPEPHEIYRQIRIYVQRMRDKERTKNGVRVLSHRDLGNGDTQINAGPTIYREPCETCIQFRSGAQLSFGITLRFDGKQTTLLSYRFYLSLQPASGLRFVRIDLNARNEAYDPLHEPRSHIHPGFEGVHIPFPVMGPIDILDRIVHVIEPHFTP